MRASNQKLKILYIAKLLTEQSDENHPIPLNDIIDYLHRAGIEAERKSIYADIEALRSFGMDIIMTRGQQCGYYRADGLFELAELKLLVDTVQASRGISQKKSLQLIRKLQQLTSKANSASLSRQVYVSGRVKSMNESLFYNVDALHDAINAGKKITFGYYEYGPDKKLHPRRNGELYSVSPYLLCWDDQYYYLVAYHERYSALSNFRVDKMKDIVITDEDCEKKDINIPEYTRRTFGMFAGEESSVEIVIPARLINAVIDRFGDVFCSTDGDSIIVQLKVAVSPAFFSWVFMIGARISSPENVRQEYSEMLKQSLGRNNV